MLGINSGRNAFVLSGLPSYQKTTNKRNAVGMVRANGRDDLRVDHDHGAGIRDNKILFRVGSQVSSSRFRCWLNIERDHFTIMYDHALL
jgi:hypothetical protein